MGCQGLRGRSHFTAEKASRHKSWKQDTPVSMCAVHVHMRQGVWAAVDLPACCGAISVHTYDNAVFIHILV